MVKLCKKAEPGCWPQVDFFPGLGLGQPALSIRPHAQVPAGMGWLLGYVLLSFSLAQDSRGKMSSKGDCALNIGLLEGLRTLGPPGQCLPALLNRVKARPPRDGTGERGRGQEGRGRETPMDRVWEAQLLQTTGDKIGLDMIFNKLQFLGKNYFLFSRQLTGASCLLCSG